jgi:hypothetical protein
MKGALNVRLILSFALLALVGARALSAAEATGDGQEQARLLLSGRGAAADGFKSHISASSAAARSASMDAQAQAREMILGRPIAKTSIVEADGLSAAGVPRNRQAVADPQAMARRMILGSEAAGNAGRIRLTSKAKSLGRRSQEAP